MDALITTRAVYRRQVTRLTNDLNTLCSTPPLDISSIRIKFELLQKAHSDLIEFDRKVMDQMVAENKDDAAMDKEIDGVEEYTTKVGTARISVEKVFQQPPLVPQPGSVSVNRSFKLPTIELRKFNGDLKEWLAFWSQFQKIDSDTTLHDSDKFQYLAQAMEEGSEARELVEGYPQSADNYPVVVEALKRRFGNEDMLLQVYVRELLKLVITNVTARDKIPFQSLYMKLESHLRALKTLKLEKADPATWLYPMVESSLPEETLLTWQRSPFSVKDGSKETPPRTRLDYLMEFLSSEVEIRQKIVLAQTGFSDLPNSKQKESKKKSDKQEQSPTLAGFHNGEVSGCVFCGKRHDSKECFTAQKMSYEDKRAKLFESHCCLSCFKPNHRSKFCKAQIKCILCGQRHHALMCNKLKEVKTSLVQEKKGETAEETTDMANHVCTNTVALQTLVVKIRGNGKEKLVRAFMDNGSQRSYILKSTAEELGLSPTSEESVVHCTFGAQTTTIFHKKYQLTIQQTGGNYTCNVEVRDQAKICNSIPRVSPRTPGLLKELKKNRIWITDVGDGCPKIEMLIGADVWANLLTGTVVNLSNGLTAIETKLGWTLSGEYKIPSSSVSMGMMTLNMATSDVSVSELWNLETIGIRDPIEIESASERDRHAKEKLLKSISRKEDGRYVVGLPWTNGHPELPSNREVALKRLHTATKKHVNSGKYEDYNQLFEQWEHERFIESVPVACKEEKVHYLPHRPVFKPESVTTPVRPVFDASCKVGKSPSLNDCLDTGPNYVQLIPELLLRFREKKFGVISDIRKAFQMIEICRDDRNLLRFLWWEDKESKKVKEYRHVRVVFGATCSPFILGAVIENHLQNVTGNNHAAATSLLQSLYVDNCVISFNTLEQYEDFRVRSVQMLAEAGMELRMWMINSSELPESEDNVTSVLGLCWNKKNDSLSVDSLKIKPIGEITKRVILSTVQQVFDPIGFLAPATITMKMLLQMAWVQKTKWDEVLQPEIALKFQIWYDEIRSLSEIFIPRLATGGELDRSKWTLHIFTDASKHAYAAVIFLRIDHGSHVSVELLAAKARVAPLKDITIPRLELLGCLIGSRLSASVKKALSLHDVKEYCWSDSSTAIAWIQRDDKWATFVGNRVTEICTHTKGESWRHVPGHHNPADLPSRGCTPSELLRSRWWKGPEWLQNPEAMWPISDLKICEEDVSKERSKSVQVTMTILDEIWKDYTFSQIVRITAWACRFTYNSRQKNKLLRKQGSLTMDEKQSAQVAVVRSIQLECFPNPDDIRGIEVTQDPQGMLRVKTRIMFRNDVTNFKCPYLLPQRHPLVTKLIEERHRKYRHAGTGFLMCNLREDFWIIQSRRAIKRVVEKCYRCRRFSAKKTLTLEAPLPEDRIRDADVFEIVGVDLAGPLLLKNGIKSWVVIFTCAVFRAVHFEVVSSISTKSFLRALETFIFRHRRPSVIYCDNGTNFVGASRLFKTLDWTQIQDAQPIRFKFSAPSGAWWGGWWERLIRSMKDLLRKSVGNAVLKKAELLLALQEVKDVMNGRPLTYVSDDPEELQPLTPAMFLNTCASCKFPERELLEGDRLRIRYRCLNAVREGLRQRFRSEYLSQLVSRPKGKPTRPLNVGEVVLIGSDLKKRNDWPLGRILELYRGKDGIRRVARLKISGGELVRPVQRLYPLEVVEKEETELKTRFGRVVKPPVRL